MIIVNIFSVQKLFYSTKEFDSVHQKTSTGNIEIENKDKSTISVTDHLFMFIYCNFVESYFSI